MLWLLERVEAGVLQSTLSPEAMALRLLHARVRDGLQRLETCFDADPAGSPMADRIVRSGVCVNSGNALERLSCRGEALTSREQSLIARTVRKNS